jgi:hypothetical protein
MVEKIRKAAHWENRGDLDSDMMINWSKGGVTGESMRRQCFYVKVERSVSFVNADER